MSSTKRHIIRVNVSGAGYSLYTITREQGIKEHDLDVASGHVPQSYLLAQGRLIRAVETGAMPWSMTFRCDDGGVNPIVAYGCHLDFRDDRRRRGLTFIHAMELPDLDSLSLYVRSVIELLSSGGVNEIRYTVADMAIGKREVATELIALANTMENIIAANLPSFAAEARGSAMVPVGAIQHDCAGAAPVAWLTAAYSSSTSPPPWEVFDVGPKGEVVRTVIAYPPGRMASLPVIRASEVLSRGIISFLNTHDQAAKKTAEVNTEEPPAGNTISSYDYTREPAASSGIQGLGMRRDVPITRELPSFLQLIETGRSKGEGVIRRVRAWGGPAAEYNVYIWLLLILCLVIISLLSVQLLMTQEIKKIIAQLNGAPAPPVTAPAAAFSSQGGETTATEVVNNHPVPEINVVALQRKHVEELLREAERIDQGEVDRGKLRILIDKIKIKRAMAATNVQSLKPLVADESLKGFAEKSQAAYQGVGVLCDDLLKYSYDSINRGENSKPITAEIKRRLEAAKARLGQ